MPVFFPDGRRVALGIGGKGSISVAEAVSGLASVLPHLIGIPSSGRACLDASTVLYQRTDGGHGRVEAYNLDTRVSYVIDPRGVNHIVGGDGLWATYQAPGGGHLGYRDSFGNVQANWFPLAVKNGRIIAKFTDAEKWIVVSGLNNFEFVDRLPVLRSRWDWGHVFEQRGLCVWPVGNKKHGFVVATDQEDSHPDLFEYPDGKLLVVSSSGADERPGELQRYWIDPATDARKDLTVASIPRIGKPLWLGWFQFGNIGPAPANVSIFVVQGEPWLMARQVGGRAIARYVFGDPDGDIAAIRRAIAHAKVTSGELAVMAYWPWKLQDAYLAATTDAERRAVLPIEADIIAIEAYRKVHESIDAFQTRLALCVETIVKGFGRRVALIPQAYTSNTTNTADLHSIAPVVAAIARDFPVWGLFAFSDGPGRATGYLDHPEIHQQWADLFAGITGTGEVITIDQPKPEVSSPKPPFVVKPTVPKQDPKELLPMPDKYYGIVADVAPNGQFQFVSDDVNLQEKSISLKTYDKPTGWEKVSERDLGNGEFCLLFKDSGRMASCYVRPDGVIVWETRPGDHDPGEAERFAGGRARAGGQGCWLANGKGPAFRLVEAD